MKSTVTERKIMRELRADMEIRAREALAAYSIHRRAYDDVDYPFAEHDGQRSVREPASQSVSNIPGGIRITVQAEGAAFEEFGNDTNGTRRFIFPRNNDGHLWIPLRGGAFRNKNLGRPRAGTITTDASGRPVLRIGKVHTYEGRHLLEKSVRTAFGMPFRR